MLHALPLLGDAPFLLVNGDIWSDIDFATLDIAADSLATLVLVDAPAYAARADFALTHEGKISSTAMPTLTYAGIGLYRPALLHAWERVIGPLPAPVRPRRASRWRRSCARKWRLAGSMACTTVVAGPM